MSKFSRWMPPVKRKEASELGQIVFMLFCGAAWPLLLIGYVVTNRFLRALASQRPGEDIGSFARSFDRRSEPYDAWVIRATWDALEPYVTFRGGRVPIRATDRFEEDLRIDFLDINYLLEEVGQRSGHSLAETTRNRFYGRVRTVGDFVRFVTRQPRVTATRHKSD